MEKTSAPANKGSNSHLTSIQKHPRFHDGDAEKRKKTNASGLRSTTKDAEKEVAFNAKQESGR